MTLGAAPLASFPPFSYQYYQEKCGMRREMKAKVRLEECREGPGPQGQRNLMTL